MQSARFSAMEFSPKVHLVIRFFSNQTFQNRIQDSSASGQAPVHSEWYREMAEWLIWLPLMSSWEEPQPTMVNYL